MVTIRRRFLTTRPDSVRRPRRSLPGLVIAVTLLVTSLTWVGAAPSSVAAAPEAPDNEADWILQPQGHPTDRTDAVMAPDSTDGDSDPERVVLFGGQTSTSTVGPLDDTWAWDGATWTRQPTAASPSARYGAAMAYHPETRKTVLFGGTSQGSPPFFSDAGLFGDTWEWDGQTKTWTNVSPPLEESPPPRHSASLAEDVNGDLVLFGGDGALSDTWVWDGDMWSKVTPENVGSPCRQKYGSASVAETCPSPPARGGRAGIAFFDAFSDGKEKATVLFGGWNTSFSFLGDTWTWDGTRWLEVTPPPGAPSPDGRINPGLAYDKTLERVVLFGGQGGSDPQDTWTWDGSAWTEHDPARRPPPDETSNGMAYWEPSPGVNPDPGIARAHVLVLSNAAALDSPTAGGPDRQFNAGFLDTWTWDGRTKGLLPPLPEPEPVDTRETLELSLNPTAIFADGKSTSKVTATVTFGGEPAPNREVWFVEGGDLQFQSRTCTTGPQGDCFVWVQASLTPGTTEIRARTRIVSDSVAFSDVDVELTELEVSCGQQPKPEPGPDGWWANLDLDFGCHGRALPRPFDGVTKMAVQADEKIVVVAPSVPDHAYFLVRYNSNGTLDGGPNDSSPEDGDFGDGGMVQIASTLEGLVIQPVDGKIIAGGGNGETGILYRFNGDGSPDNGFGTDGTGSISLPEMDYLTALALQPDGKLLAAGGRRSDLLEGDYPVIVTRLNSDGSPDNGESADADPSDSFGRPGDGSIQFKFRDLQGNFVSSIAIQHDEGKDKIVLGGGWGSGFGIISFAVHWGLARLLPNGDFDPSFNPCPSPDGECGGKAAPVFESNYEALAQLVIQPADNKIVAVGFVSERDRERILLGRFLPNGTPDLDFNPCAPSPPPCGGKASFNFGGTASARAVALQDDGKIVVGGYGINGEKRGYLLARFNPDGTVDDCGFPGHIVTDFADSRYGVNDVIVHDGKILAGGMPNLLRFQGGGPSLFNKVSVGDVTVAEPTSGSTPASFEVRLDQASCGPVSVNWSTANIPGAADSAKAGSDYTARSDTVTFAADEVSKRVEVPVLGDTVPEPTERFVVDLSNPRVAAVSSLAAARPRDLVSSPVTLRDPQGTGSITDAGGLAASVPRVPSPSPTPAPSPPSSQSLSPPGPASKDPSAASRAFTTPAAAGLLVPGANLPPPSLAQGTQIQAQQQTQQQAQQQAQAQLMAGVMNEKQRQAQVEKAGLEGKDAYLASARRQTSPAFAWAFSWIAALATFGAGLAYRKQTSPQPARNRRK